MDYRKIYSKLVKLGKDKTPEGATARRKARQFKDNERVEDRDLREAEDIDPDVIDMMFRELENYNYSYVPVKQIESPTTVTVPRMDAKYIPQRASCPECDIAKTGFPELIPTGSGTTLLCWDCRREFAYSSEGRLIEQREVEETFGDNDPSNPGNYSTQNRRKDGSIIGGWQANPPKPAPKPVPKGTPKNPRVVP